MAHPHSSDPSAGHESLHHEESDIQVGPIFKFLGWLTVLGVVVQLVVWFMLSAFESQARHEEIQYPLAVGQQDRQPPLPRLQVEPKQDLRAYESHEQELLEGYRWVDKSAGVVRIPIEEAMKRVVSQGLPARSADAGREGR